jgi:hypothetical protein
MIVFVFGCPLCFSEDGRVRYLDNCHNLRANTCLKVPGVARAVFLGGRRGLQDGDAFIRLRPNRVPSGAALNGES